MCDCCIYETKYKSNYTKHLKTKKHAKLSNKYNNFTPIDKGEKYGKPMISMDAPSLFEKNLTTPLFIFGKIIVSISEKKLITPSCKELIYREKSKELIKKYNSVYEKIFQEIHETIGLPERTFSSIKPQY